MRINNNSIIRSLGALVLTFGLTACLEADEGSAPEVQADAQEEVQAAPAVQEADAAPAAEVAPEAVVPEQDEAPKAEPKAEPKKDAVEGAPKPELDVEEIIEPEVQASIPDVLTVDHDTRLKAQYEQTLAACTEIRTVCMDDGHGEEKCMKIEEGCKQAAESLRSGATTRAGLMTALKSLVEAVLGVGDAAVSLVRCVGRLLGCALTTLSLHCATDLVECVVEDALAG